MAAEEAALELMMILGRARRPRSAGGPAYLTGALTVVTGIILVIPLVMLVVGALRTTAPGQPGDWSLDAMVAAFTAEAVWGGLGNSLILAFTSTVIALLLATVLALISARTNVPMRGLITPAMLFLLAMPALFYALGWNLLGSPASGLINKGASLVFGGEVVLVDINTWPGVILVVALKATSFVYLLIIGPIRSLDPSLAEAGLLAGSRRTGVVLRVVIPALAPSMIGAAILAFIVALTLFDIPRIIAWPAGIHVYSTELFSLVSGGSLPRYGEASAMGVLLVVITLVLVILSRRYQRGRDFDVIATRGYSGGMWDLGPSRWVATALVLLFVLVAVIGPLVQLILGSFQPLYGLYNSLTLANYEAVLSSRQFFESLGVTIQVSLIGGLVAMILAFGVSYFVRRRPSQLSDLLASSLWLPWAMPGIVLGLAITWSIVAITPLNFLYGTSWAVMIGLVIVALPIAARATTGALIQIPRELEEASALSGATRFQTAVHVLLQLIAPAFASGWFLCVIVISGVLDLPLLLGGTGKQPFPVFIFTLHNTGLTSEAAAAYCLLLGGGAVVGGVVYVLLRLLARFIRVRRIAAPATQQPDIPVEASR